MWSTTMSASMQVCSACGWAPRAFCPILAILTRASAAPSDGMWTSAASAPRARAAASEACA